MMGRIFLAALLFGRAASGQTEPGNEEKDLRQAVSEAGSSPIDFVHAIESHISKYPQSARRGDLYRALVKGSIEAKDNRRIALYGEQALQADPDNLDFLEQVTRALLDQSDKESTERALRHAMKLQELMELAGKQDDKDLTPSERARRDEALVRGRALALLLEGRAQGRLGKPAEAAALEVRSYGLNATEEAAREAGHWLAVTRNYAEAARRYADALTVTDAKATAAMRALDRQQMGELFAKAPASKRSLGDLLLEAYDRNTTVVEQRKLTQRQNNPNADAANPYDFTLSALSGPPLRLASLKGKVVVMDFWATWCGPCRTQHPLIEVVKSKFKELSDVVFLAIDTDEERSLVEPFLNEQHWDKTVYFEDGLQRAMKVSNIPTTLIFNKNGEIYSRMNGFLPDRFVTMLVERIEDALKDRN